MGRLMYSTVGNSGEIWDRWAVGTETVSSQSASLLCSELC